MEQLLISGDDDIEHNAIGDYIRHNYLKLKVYVSSKTVEKIIELPKYDFFSFLASLGGATSLYLGMSFIVIFELFELFIRSVTHVCFKCFAPKQRRSNETLKLKIKTHEVSPKRKAHSVFY